MRRKLSIQLKMNTRNSIQDVTAVAERLAAYLPACTNSGSYSSERGMRTGTKFSDRFMPYLQLSPTPLCGARIRGAMDR